MYENIKVVGMHFRGAWAKDYVSALLGGEVLRLEREPENQYDTYAIKVLTPTGNHLGYIERTATAFIGPEMDEDTDQVWVAEVTSLEADSRNTYPIVTVRHWQDSDEEALADGAD